MGIAVQLNRGVGLARDLVRESIGQVRPVEHIGAFLLVGLRKGMETSAAALDEVETACTSLNMVTGAWFVPELDRLVVKVKPGADPDTARHTLIGCIAQQEKAHGHGRGRFHTRSRCPDFRIHRLRLALEMGLDLAGFSSGLLMRRIKDRTFHFFADLSALGLLVEYTPELRHPLDAWVGYENSELMLRYLETVSESFSQGWSGSLMDLVKRGMHWQMERAREACWRRIAEEVLCRVEHRGRVRIDGAARPCPVPDGPIETYQRTAEKFSLAAFSAGMAFTHDLSRSAATLFSAVPRPASLGRDGFRLTLVRELADTGVLVLGPEVLDLLDRVDRILIDGRLVTASRLVVTTRYPHTKPGLPLETLNEVLQGEVSESDLLLTAPQSIEDLPARIRRWWESTGQPLESLRLFQQGGRVKDAALVEQVSDRTIESLLNRARLADIRLEIADKDGREAGERIRAHQERGETVLAIGETPLLQSADIAVGVLHEKGAMGSGADLLTANPLDTLWRLISAIERARRMARQSVELAKIDAFSGLILMLEPLERHILSRLRISANIVSVAALMNGYRLARRIDGMPAEVVDDPTPWHAMDLDSVREQLAAMGQQGASGTMQRPEPPSLLALWLEEMQSPLVPVLLTGTGLAALTGAVGDAVLIATVVGINGWVGGFQRKKTEERLQALGMNQNVIVAVNRQGEPLSVHVDALVPGDEISLRAGDLVPADARVVQAEALELDESSLTGESLPVKKSARPSYSTNLADRHSMLYEGTTVVQGQARALIVKEKARSEARRSHVVGQRQGRGVETRLDRLTELTVPVAAFSGVALLLAGLSRGRPVQEVVSSGVSLAVAAVPEGLPILATLSQLAAAGRLGELGALARNPQAIEALGRMTVLCADKTGTLTEGTLALRYVAVDGEACPVEALDETVLDVLAVSWMASPDDNGGGEDMIHMTDRAIGNAVTQYAPQLVENIAAWHRVKELPFKSERGYHAALFQNGGKKRVCVKGAPEVVIERCNRWRTDGKVVALEGGDRDRLIKRSHQLAGQGYRVLAVAERPARSLTLNRDKVTRLIFRGFVALADPVRPSARAALQDLLHAGVRAKMITGDHPVTAEAIARELGIDGGDAVLAGSRIDSMSDEELTEEAGNVSVFARVTPAQKARIVKALQATGEVVGMTGDGANDAAAIRLADVGIALGRECSPSAQQAADLLVVDSRIETIVAAVMEGRALWSAVRDAVSLLVGGNLGEIGFTLVAGLFEGRSPLNARQLLLINLLTDTLPALAVALRKPNGLQADNLMREGPEASLGEILTHEIEWRAGLTGGVTTLVWGLDRWLQGSEKASTVAMLSLIGSQLTQTLIAGKGSRDVALASLGSMAMLALVAEIPGLSRMFGCSRPGLVGWGLVGASLGISLAGSYLQPWIEDKSQSAAERWAGRINQWLTDDSTTPSVVPSRS